MISSTLIDFANEHEHDDIHMLALHANLYPGIDIQQAIQQIKGRKIAKDKIPGWYQSQRIIYPKHISLEQCSSEQTACYKAGLVNGNSMVDLTGGLGVDFSFLSAKFRDAIYVEKQSELADIAKNNFRELGLSNASIENTDAVKYLRTMPAVDLIYIDPARRDSAGKKVVHIEDCTPNIIEIESLLDTKARQTMIKLSPMLDITLALKALSHITDIYIISHNNECKELIFIKKKSGDDELQYHCVNIHKSGVDTFSFRKAQEDDATVDYASELGLYLYEPNSSLLKAGSYKYIAEYYALEKLHPNSHLYTSNTLHADFQGRKFKIEQICTLGKKDIKYLQEIKQANISSRNFPLSVAEIRKKIKLEEGGDIYIFATTLFNGKKILLICKKADQ